MTAVWGALLAAGASTRMGAPKALATLEGEAFASRVVDALTDGGCARVLVVVAEPHGEAIARALDGRATVVWNPSPEAGQIGSLQRAVEATDAGCGGLVVALVDQPRVRAATVAALLRAHADGGARWVRPRFDGRHGHPYLVDRALFAALGAAGGSEGARPVLRAVRDPASVDVDDPGILDDVDTAVEARAIGACLPDR